jgi:hypothetical protein
MAYDLEWLLEPAELAHARNAYFSAQDDDTARRRLAAYDAARNKHRDAVLHLKAGQMAVIRPTMGQLGAIGSPDDTAAPGIPRAAIDTNGPTIVAPEKVREALRRIDAGDSATIGAAIRGNEDLWAYWVAWLRGAALRGGFISH